MEPVPSKFSLLDFLVQESHISRLPLENQSELKIEIKPRGIYKEGEQIFQLNLEVNITEENHYVDISILAVGIFSFDQTLEMSALSDYFTMNAPAIIFPFIRSYIAALTSLSGNDTIMLPVLNMAGIQDDLRDNIEIIPLEKVE